MTGCDCRATTPAICRYPTFQLLRNAEVTGLIEEDGRITGVRYQLNDRERCVRIAHGRR
jgi:hypothetical protein